MQDHAAAEISKEGNRDLRINSLSHTKTTADKPQQRQGAGKGGAAVILPYDEALPTGNCGG